MEYVPGPLNTLVFQTWGIAGKRVYPNMAILVGKLKTVMRVALFSDSNQSLYYTGPSPNKAIHM